MIIRVPVSVLLILLPLLFTACMQMPGTQQSAKQLAEDTAGSTGSDDSHTDHSVADDPVATVSNTTSSTPNIAIRKTMAESDSSRTTDAITEDNEQDFSQSKVKKSRSIDELLLFQPARYPAGDWNPDGLKFEDVWMTTGDGVKIHGWYCPHVNPQAVVLYAHGNAGNLSHRAAMIEQLVEQHQVSVMIFDYRGYGRSEGKPTAAGALNDARAARAELAKRAGIKEADVVLMGRSLGGAILVPLAAELSPRGLILQSTFSSLKNIAKHHFPVLAWMVPKSKLDSAKMIPDAKCPVLISHGDRDTVIPFEQGRALFEAANEPKQFMTIEGAGHNDPQPKAYDGLLAEFFAELPG